MIFLVLLMNEEIRKCKCIQAVGTLSGQPKIPEATTRRFSFSSSHVFHHGFEMNCNDAKGLN